MPFYSIRASVRYMVGLTGRAIKRIASPYRYNTELNGDFYEQIGP